MLGILYPNFFFFFFLSSYTPTTVGQKKKNAQLEVWRLPLGSYWPWFSWLPRPQSDLVNPEEICVPGVTMKE